MQPKSNIFNVLSIGDVVGSSGRKALFKSSPEIKRKYLSDITIINGENLAGGFGHF